MSIYDFKVRKIDGTEIGLRDYEGKVLLIVNTATGCGFTPQYDGLEALYKKYREKGFEILNFPCNQFLNQAPGTGVEIASFCKLNFGTEFETFDKIEVNGENAHPLYKFLKEQAPSDIDNGGMARLKETLSGLSFSVADTEIQWNFTKFLIDRKGNVAARFAPTVAPDELADHIEKFL